MEKIKLKNPCLKKEFPSSKNCISSTCVVKSTSRRSDVRGEDNLVGGDSSKSILTSILSSFAW
jgi:hypothetical protein